MVSTRLPSRRQNSASLSTIMASARGGGVMMHQRPLNRLAKPASGPDFSVPATGCAGITCTPGRAAPSTRATLSFTEPTSLTTVSGLSSGAISAATAAMAPTGTHNITRSASTTAAPAPSATSSARPSRITRSRTCSSASLTTSCTVGMASRTARASDEPIRPMPMMATREKGSIRWRPRPRLRHNRAGQRPRCGFRFRCRSRCAGSAACPAPPDSGR